MGQPFLVRLPGDGDSLAERHEFELPVPICEQSEDSIGLRFAISRRSGRRYRPAEHFALGSLRATGAKWPALLFDPCRDISRDVFIAHATGVYLANAGQDPRAIRLYLGHKNIQHTDKGVNPRLLCRAALPVREGVAIELVEVAVLHDGHEPLLPLQDRHVG